MPKKTSVDDLEEELTNMKRLLDIEKFHRSRAEDRTKALTEILVRCREVICDLHTALEKVPNVK